MIPEKKPVDHKQFQPQANQNFDVCLKNRVRGALWGAVLGDVIGAFLEFNQGIDKKKIQQAFLIKGGGMHKLQPGQPTDDSQLAYSVGRGLLKGKGTLDLNKIATQMGNWYLSKPVDVGNTIRKSVPKACNMKVHQAHLCRKGASECSKQSQSNGTLMAITALSLWCMNLSPIEIFTAVRQYTILIHPNDMVTLTNVLYTLILIQLVKRQQQDEKQQNWEENQIKFRLNLYLKAKRQLFEQIKPETYLQNKLVQQFKMWLRVVEDGIDNESLLQKQLSPTKKPGWCLVALTYTICSFVTKASSFKKSMEYILGLKGDTDTNACIAGGLIGGYLGFEQISIEMKKQINTIQKWRPLNVRRPEWMVPGLVVQNLAVELMKICPSELKVVGGESEYKKGK